MAVPHVILTDEKFKFFWKHEEVELFRALWESDYSIYEIAERMNEDPDNIALLAMDQAQKGKINNGTTN